MFRRASAIALALSWQIQFVARESYAAVRVATAITSPHCHCRAYGCQIFTLPNIQVFTILSMDGPPESLDLQHEPRAILSLVGARA